MAILRIEEAGYDGKTGRVLDLIAEHTEDLPSKAGIGSLALVEDEDTVYIRKESGWTKYGAEQE